MTAGRVPDHDHIVERERLVYLREMVDGPGDVIQRSRIAPSWITHRPVIDVPSRNSPCSRIFSQGRHQRVVKTRPPESPVDENYDLEGTVPRGNPEVASL